MRIQEKKYRGIAGGTIPRVPMTPSLAAGVTLAASPLEFNLVVVRVFPVDVNNYNGGDLFYL
ncbi:hypothetical protein ELS82_13145 [Vibrio ouci]|uniref:Uncharacterized protein n=1 Tax=Vibrio ouci TaxID=2499078 RepID=A0A4Y8WEF7_9VIBR|nr:hypothetical protein ELS82_13145 [Vibrio ouci]